MERNFWGRPPAEWALARVTAVNSKHTLKIKAHIAGKFLSRGPFLGEPCQIMAYPHLYNGPPRCRGEWTPPLHRDSVAEFVPMPVAPGMRVAVDWPRAGGSAGVRHPSHAHACSCMHACTHACACMHAHARSCMHEHACMLIHACMHACIHACMRGRSCCSSMSSHDHA